jgi:hypothetical protein
MRERVLEARNKAEFAGLADGLCDTRHPMVRINLRCGDCVRRDGWSLSWWAM